MEQGYRPTPTPNTPNTNKICPQAESSQNVLGPSSSYVGGFATSANQYIANVHHTGHQWEMYSPTTIGNTPVWCPATRVATSPVVVSTPNMSENVPASSVATVPFICQKAAAVPSPPQNESCTITQPQISEDIADDYKKTFQSLNPLNLETPSLQSLISDRATVELEAVTGSLLEELEAKFELHNLPVPADTNPDNAPLTPVSWDVRQLDAQCTESSQRTNNDRSESSSPGIVSFRPIDSNSAFEGISENNDTMNIEVSEMPRLVIPGTDAERKIIQGKMHFLPKTVRNAKVKKGAKRSYHLLDVPNHEEYMMKIVSLASENKFGSFKNRKVYPASSALQEKHKNVLNISPSYYFYCERHAPCRSTSKMTATETRANSCGAFLAFVFYEIKGRDITLAEIREFTAHTGHNPDDRSEWVVNRLDPSVHDFIEKRLQENAPKFRILVECGRQAREGGHHDAIDHRYYPLDNDIETIKRNLIKQKRIAEDDSKAVDLLCNQDTGTMRDRIILYKRMGPEEPLIIVYQNQSMIHMLRVMRQNVIFMDASYRGLTQYGYAIYAIHGIGPSGRGVPIAYFVLSGESTDVIADCLKALVDNANAHGITLFPRSVMLDMDVKEAKAIRQVFPHATILWCWFHVLQGVYRDLRKHGSGVSGKDFSPARREVLGYLRQMKYAGSKEKFHELVDGIPVHFKEKKAVQTILLRKVEKAEFWANHARPFYHEEQETNNISERFFLSLKYEFLEGKCMKRVDELLLLLDGEIAEYHNYMQVMYDCGRVKSKRSGRSPGKVQAAVMIKQGLADQVVIKDDYDCKCVVPSAEAVNHIDSGSERTYDVNLVQATCTCPGAPNQQDLCKHYYLALHAAAKCGFDIESMRHRVAEDLVTVECYDVMESVTVVFYDAVTYVSGSHCTCIASSHGVTCVCKMVAELVKGPPSQQPEQLHSTPEGQPCEALGTQVVEDEEGPSEAPVSFESAKQVVLSRREQKIKESLLNMLSIVEAGAFETRNPEPSLVEQNVLALEQQMSLVRYQPVYRHHVQQPNSTNRRKIDASLKKSTTTSVSGNATEPSKFIKRKQPRTQSSGKKSRTSLHQNP